MRAFTRRAARRAARIRKIYAINSAGIVRMQIVKIDDVVGICQFEFEMLRICFQSLNQLCCLSIHTPGFLNDFGVASRGPTAKRQPHFRQHLSLLIFLRIETRNRQWVIETMPLVCLIFSGVVCCVFFSVRRETTVVILMSRCHVIIQLGTHLLRPALPPPPKGNEYL